MGTGAGDEEAKVSVSSSLGHGGDTAWKNGQGDSRVRPVDRDARQGMRAGGAPARNLPGRPRSFPACRDGRVCRFPFAESLHHRVSSLLLLASPPPFVLPRNRGERKVQLAAEAVADEVHTAQTRFHPRALEELNESLKGGGRIEFRCQQARRGLDESSGRRRDG